MKRNGITFIFLTIVFSINIYAQIPANVLLQIVRAEDERRYDQTLENLLKHPNENIRRRAALAVGRIGDERAIGELVKVLTGKNSDETKATAIFALGEIESLKGADEILRLLDDEKTPSAMLARAVEAAGKIAAANPKNEKSEDLGEAVLEVLDAQSRSEKNQNREVVLFGLTAVLRARPADGNIVTGKFLTSLDARIRIDAGNTLSRLRAKSANPTLRTMLMSDDDAVARATAARALGAAEDKDAAKILLEAALTDEDSRVRVSAIRALGALKDKAALEKLLERGEKLLEDFRKSKYSAPSEKSELLEIASIAGRILPNSNDEKAVRFLQGLRVADKFQSSETEIALAQIAPEIYLQFFNSRDNGFSNWRIASSYASGLSEIAKQENEELKGKGSIIAAAFFGEFIESVAPANQAEMSKAVPDLVRAVAAFKAKNVSDLLRSILEIDDLFTRAAAADLLGEQPFSKENFEALEKAFLFSFSADKKYNDAQLSILDALFKLDKEKSVTILFVALDSKDFLVRKKAFEMLQNKDLKKSDLNETMLKKFKTEKKNLVLSDAKGWKLGTVLNTNADYLRAISRKNGTVKAVLTTEKGAFTIDLMPEDAPLTVDNFIKLARANYFNGLNVHRVVPNFVMQDGDSRGDGNGGPGWSIRCEINTLDYRRGAVGMALSGKDTGGSQWFVTHSPQPHLDGGYTVFGYVNETDMKIVDQIVRGDKILNVKIVEEKIQPVVRRQR